MKIKQKNRLKDLRQDKDKTQKEIADKFNLQVTQYRRYETGESPITLEWTIKFARYYNVSIDYIAGITNIPKPINDNKKTKQEILIEAYERNKEMQKAIDKLLDIK